MAKKGTNIYKRKDGRWEARYIKGYNLSGKTKYGYVYGKTYKEAREKQLQAQIANSSSQMECTQDKKCFAEYCQEWLLLNRSRVKRSTYVKYHNIVNNHIIPRLGQRMPQSLDTVILETFSNTLLKGGSLCGNKPLSAKTVRDILTVLHSILRYTNKQSGNSMGNVEFIYPKEKKKEMRVLSREEQSQLVQYLLLDMDTCKFGILLALMTGLRIGEICALRWENISLMDQSIYVGNTMQRLQVLNPLGSSKTQVIVDDPKSDTSRRVIPLTKQAMELCEKMNPKCPAAFVLTGQSHHFMEPRTLQYRLAKYAAECGLDDLNFHALRHTFATRCVEVNFEIKTLSEILGHSSVQVTLDRYVHSSMELKRENMSKLPAIGF